MKRVDVLDVVALRLNAPSRLAADHKVLDAVRRREALVALPESEQGTAWFRLQGGVARSSVMP